MSIMLNLTFQFDTDTRAPYISLIKLKSGICQTFGIIIKDKYICIDTAMHFLKINSSHGPFISK
jgi:hypothetical protein